MRKRGAEQLSLLGEASAETTRRVFMHRARSSKAATIAPLPWECVVLGTDQASHRSGWAIALRAEILESGEIDTADPFAMRAVVVRALTIAAELGLPCVFVYEGHSMRRFGNHSYAVPAHLQAAKMLWLKMWQREAKAFGHLGKHCAAPLAAWRSAMLGPHTIGMPREEVRPHEQARAKQITGRVCGGDESPAVCIAVFGTRAGQVGKLLGKKLKAATRAAWARALQ